MPISLLAFGGYGKCQHRFSSSHDMDMVAGITSPAERPHSDSGAAFPFPSAPTRAIREMDLAVNAFQLARDAVFERLSELASAENTLRAEIIELKLSLEKERTSRQAGQAKIRDFAHQLRVVVLALDKSLEKERAGRKVEQETMRIERAEMVRSLHEERAARRAELQAMRSESTNLAGFLANEQLLRRQEREEARYLEERLRTEMAAIVRERDGLASRLDEALRISTQSAPAPVADSSDKRRNPLAASMVVKSEPTVTTVKMEEPINSNFVISRKRRLSQDGAIKAEEPPTKMLKPSSSKSKSAAASWPPGSRKIEVVITRRPRARKNAAPSERAVAQRRPRPEDSENTTPRSIPPRSICNIHVSDSSQAVLPPEMAAQFASGASAPSKPKRTRLNADQLLVLNASTASTRAEERVLRRP
ncbi:hypothetical protein C8J57DRAFT_1635629 [Mycena rebaudengoi]|nr:hypothetical protein C8J57DRAFT_1635629 [Mycena rebaudengoi]